MHLLTGAASREPVAPVVEKNLPHMHALTHWCVIKKVLAGAEPRPGYCEVRVALQPPKGAQVASTGRKPGSMLQIQLFLRNPRLPLETPLDAAPRAWMSPRHIVLRSPVRVEGNQSESPYYLWKLFRQKGGVTWSRGGNPPVRPSRFPPGPGIPQSPVMSSRLGERCVRQNRTPEVPRWGSSLTRCTCRIQCQRPGFRPGGMTARACNSMTADAKFSPA